MQYTILQSHEIDITRVNTTHNTNGRLGNQIIRNLVADYFAKKNDLNFTYGESEKMVELGIDLYNGKKTFSETLIIRDDIIDSLFNEDIFNMYAKNRNVLFSQYDITYTGCHAWCQTSVVADYIRRTLNIRELQNCNPHMLNKNDSGNDLFIHVRQGDITGSCAAINYEYYDSVISEIPHDLAFITSDSIDGDMCQKLIKKHNLKIYDSGDVDTLLFGSTFKNIVLSSGTYSWVLGLLGVESNIFYPKIHVKWHGDIFVFPDWNEISY